MSESINASDVASSGIPFFKFRNSQSAVPPNLYVCLLSTNLLLAVLPQSGSTKLLSLRGSDAYMDLQMPLYFNDSNAT